MSGRTYRLLDHTADLGLEVWGRDPADLFTNVAAALAEVMFTGPAGKALEHREMQIEGLDWTDLMVNWLRELLYLWQGEGRRFGPVQIETINDCCLRARVGTRLPDPREDAVQREIKAVTYHQALVEPRGAQWHARVIFDI